MKGVYSPDDLKNKKNVKGKQLSIRIQFFIVGFPMRWEQIFSIVFRLLGRKNWCILNREI